MDIPTRQVICRFCQQPVPYSPIDQASKMGLDIYWCQTCQAEYLYFRDSTFASSCSLYTQIKDKTYRWTTTATDRSILWYVKTPGTPKITINKDCELLYSMGPEDNQPNITPNNIQHKVKTYLIFL